MAEAARGGWDLRGREAVSGTSGACRRPRTGQRPAVHYAASRATPSRFVLRLHAGRSFNNKGQLTTTPELLLLFITLNGAVRTYHLQ